MIRFELNKGFEGVEIYLDRNGIDELISYLNGIKDNEDHIHLIIGNELDENIEKNSNSLIKQVKVIHVE